MCSKISALAEGGLAIIKRIVWILGGLVGLILGGEMVFHPLGEAIVILLEFLEKFTDIAYETLAGMDAYQSQKATAWTGFIVALGLLFWGGIKLKKLYYRAKAAAPQWWEDKKKEIRLEWQQMSWKEKAGYLGGVFAMVGLLTLFI